MSVFPSFSFLLSFYLYLFTNEYDNEHTTKNSQRKTKSTQKQELCFRNWAAIRFVIYIITVFEEIFKFGKADADRVTQSSGLPTRLHQQLRKLKEIYGEQAIDFETIADLLGITTAEAKELEKANLQDFFDANEYVPKGNQKSVKPKKK